MRTMLVLAGHRRRVQTAESSMFPYRQALGELETERANPYKEKWQQAEAMLKVAQAQVASLEEKLKQLQIDAARDRAVAEVAERKREDSERKRESAERRAADLERSNSGAAKDFTRGNPPGERPSSRAYGSRRRPSRYDDPFAAVGWEGVPSYNPSYAPQPPPQPQAPQQSEEVHLLRGALEQAQRTNTALVNAELRRSGLLEDPQVGGAAYWGKRDLIATLSRGQGVDCKS